MLRWRGLVFVAFVLPMLAGCEAKSQPATAAPSAAGAPASRPNLELIAVVARGKAAVADFFDAAYPLAFDVRIFPNRADFTAFVQKKWDMPELECWMVALGTGSTFAILAPEAWRTEACEHDPDDALAVERLVTHELVHVFHGQHRPDMEFDFADEIAWFVEGLAVYASGQLDDARVQRTIEVVRAGGGPQRLSDAWSGPARYGVAGSMVRLVDERLGRPGVMKLLEVEQNAPILRALEMSEAEFLAAWRAALLDPK